MFASGSCLCGAIAYTASEPPIRMAQCHCEDCRKLSGTGHLSQAFFKREAVAIEGTPAVFENTAESGTGRLRYFCDRCGSTLFSQRANATEVIGIAVGTMQDSSWFEPGVVFYTGQQPAWDRIDPAIKAFAKMS